MIGISLFAAWTLFAAAEGPGTYFVPPKGTDNVVSQAESRADAPKRTVAFLGGSITEMDGFRPRVMRLLRAKYPSVDFVEISSGLSSTCSDTGAMRFKADILEKGLPDLLIVDAAVNDDQDGHFDRRRMVRGMEGILRSARAANPSMALVVALFVNCGQFNQLAKGETPLQYAVHAEVAKHYGAAVADVGSALAASAKAGGLGWEGYRDCHPSPEGCDFAAAVVLKAVGEVFDPLKVQPPIRLPARLDAASYDGAAFIPFDRVSRDAAWRVSCPDWAKIPGSKRKRFVTGDSLWTETDGATFTVAFRGTALAAILTAGPDAGDIEVSVDGGPWTRRGLFTPYSKSLHYPFTAMLAEGLSVGEHTASVRVRAAKRDGVRRCAVRIYRLAEVLSEAGCGWPLARDFNVGDYPSTGAAADACRAAGGGRIVVPKGVWKTGKVHLASNCELHLEDGAELVFSDNPKDYLPAVRVAYEGVECFNYSPLVYACGATNVAVTGKGTLRAEHRLWYAWHWPKSVQNETKRKLYYKWSVEGLPVEKRVLTDIPQSNCRPQFIHFNRCRDVRIEGVMVRDSPFWCIHTYACEGVIVRNVDVCAHIHNSDGIDLEMTKNALVEDCVFCQGDDAICVKAGKNADGRRVGICSENIEIRNCEIKAGHQLLAIGSEVSAGIRNVWLHDCKMTGATFNGLLIKTNKERGGFVENIRFERVTAEHLEGAPVAIDANTYYSDPEPGVEIVRTRIRDIFVRDVAANEAERTYSIIGDPALPIQKVCLENVSVRHPLKPDGVAENVEQLLSR